MKGRTRDPSARLQAYARAGGFLYLFQAVAFVGSVLLAPALMSTDYAAAAGQLASAERTYRIGMTMMVIASAAIIPLSFCLYVVLKPVVRHLALLAMVFRTAESTIYAVMGVASFVALSAAASANAGFPEGTRVALVGLLMESLPIGFNAATIFFVCGSGLFFYLLVRTRVIPRFVSLLGLVGSIAAGIGGIGALIVPETAVFQTGGALLLLAELVTGVWLLVRGVNYAYCTTAESVGPNATSR